MSDTRTDLKSKGFHAIKRIAEEKTDMFFTEQWNVEKTQNELNTILYVVNRYKFGKITEQLHNEIWLMKDNIWDEEAAQEGIKFRD